MVDGAAGDDGPRESAEDQRDGRDLRGRFVDGNPWRFTPGQSGNPNGRPRGARSLFRQAFRELAEQDERFAGGPIIVAKALILEAVRRDGRNKVAACREVLDRAVGKVPQPFRMEVDDEERDSFTDLTIRVVTPEEIAERRRLLARGNGDGDGGVPE